ncbi:hypothetical protein GALMADRAFT_133165 [Galerina marginata CBS 339.88]|uniref:Anaphase-promoting complex subunit 4 WD40 domain-containing protein n=1 Tax=Galerina marginata (strain CBS 339.88) TaxID=685588 RepID=A0A067TXI7_GALM3|nr:hypothetical protein GALMADRAFT_133165 [Galerina marginata CBS 339.88]
MAWGIQSTHNHLFVSCKPEPSVSTYPPVKKNWETPLYNLDATEAADALGLNPAGAILALSTRTEENRHILRLYDVGHQEHQATTKINIETLPSRTEGEVNCAVFSPDGLYNALARNDDHVHVYDDFVFGVVKAQWLHSEQAIRLAPVTTGEDGCVRLWNPLMSNDNKMSGISVTEVNSDIG